MLKERLLKRGISNNNAENIDWLVRKYNLKPTIKNFDSSGFFLIDPSGATARVVSCTHTGKSVQLNEPINADIGLLFAGSMLLGWVEASKIDSINEPINVKSIHPMSSEVFQFKQECPHMDVYGGFFDGETWECANCGMVLIGNV